MSQNIKGVTMGDILYRTDMNTFNSVENLIDTKGQSISLQINSFATSLECIKTRRRYII